MFEMKIKGLDKYKEQFDFLQANFPKEIEKFLVQTAKTIEKDVNRRTPVLTGDLKGSWKVTDVKKEGDSMYLKIYNDAETEYQGRVVNLGQFVEYGHSITTKTGEVTGHVDGYYMLTSAKKLAQRQIKRRLKTIFNNLEKNL